MEGWRHLRWFGPPLGPDRLRVTLNGVELIEGDDYVWGTSGLDRVCYVRPGLPDDVQIQRVVVPLTHKINTDPSETPVK